MDIKAAQIKAKNKLQFWTFVLFSILVIGAGFEYFSLIRPLDEVTMVYFVQKPVQVTASPKAEQAIKEKEKAPEQSKNELKTSEAKPQIQPVKNNSYATQEFLDYMQNMKEKVEAVTFDKTVLDKIKQNAPQVPEKALQESQFEDNKIQVYDEHRGVVEVIETPAEGTVQPAEEVVQPVAETIQPAEEAIQPVAETEEKPQHPQLSEEEAIALQMQTKPDEEEKAEQQAEEATEKANQAVQELMDNVGVKDDEEKPIVLIPGLQQSQE